MQIISAPNIKVLCLALWDSSVSIVTRLGTGRLGFVSPYGQGIFLFAIASRPDLEPTQPSIRWGPGTLSPGVKQPGRKADTSPLSSAEVKNMLSYTSAPQHTMAWCSVKEDTSSCGNS
jgi:hypothetical protein